MFWVNYGGGGGGANPGSNSNAIAIIPDASGRGSWPPGGNDQLMWVSDEDYGDPSADAASSSAFDGRQSQPGKMLKARNPHGDSQGGNRTNSSKVIGEMFFKTKLCCKFRAGTCPYITNCNFAHGIEELRKPPPNWQEIVAAHEEGSDTREERQIPTMSWSVVAGNSERSYKGWRCKKFYAEEGCLYGDRRTFVHDEQSKPRESVAISLSPMVGGGGCGGGANGSIHKPSTWKTRICNKWQMTGYCPFGSKCHFAHGAAELHRYGGGLMETEGRDASAVPVSKQVGTLTNTSVASNILVPHADIYHIGVPSQGCAGVLQRQGQRSIGKWKGPDKISKIYGDWIDDIE